MGNGRFSAKKKPGKNHKTQKQSRILEAVVSTITVIATLALVFHYGSKAMDEYVVFAGARPMLKTSEASDLRDLELTVEEYQALAAQMPDTKILWSIPIGGQYYDSSSEQIRVSEFTEEDVPAFALFHDLKKVDATNAECYAEIRMLQAAMPDLTVEWALHLGSKRFDPASQTLDLVGSGVTFRELAETMAYVAPGAVVELGESGLTEQERSSLTEAFPDVCFSWNLELEGKHWPNSAEVISYAGEQVDADALIAAAGQFLQVQELDVTGCGFTMDELTALQEAFGGAFIRSEISLFGKPYTTADTEIDLSGIRMEDSSLVEQAVALMPNLEKVIMSDCGFTDEEMDALNKKYDGVRFVWTVHFSVYSLRTDATMFCASDLPQYDNIGMKLTDEEIAPLKYCTDLVALDLGHMYYTNLSFLEGMTKLKYLIIVDARFSDISVLAQMKDLVYLEIFKNQIDDLSPLLECTNLRHLNIGYTKGFDHEVLKQMTWLERLWFPGNGMDDGVIDDLKAALPDTRIYAPKWDEDGSTGGGWREDPIYYEMRNMFNMFYQPGGTGMDNN